MQILKITQYEEGIKSIEYFGVDNANLRCTLEKWISKHYPEVDAVSRAKEVFLAIQISEYWHGNFHAYAGVCCFEIEGDIEIAEPPK